MSDSSHDKSIGEQRLEQVLAEYLRSIEAGRPLDEQQYIAQHPDLADELRAFFANREALDRLAKPLRAAANTPTLATGPSARGNPNPERVRYFGDYELLDEIARGGMGVVYKAAQVNLKRIVALKMILVGRLANQDEVKRFYAEAQAAAKLEHPNIVPIFEIGQHDGQHYFTMAYVDGESLAHRVARETLPPREAAAIILKVTRAIAFAHAEGVMHRDLKPANILIDRAGEPHVTDFGLAKQLGSAEAGATLAGQLTVTGQVLGTPSYMSPEQAAGKTSEVGPPADVYSLGAVLYCLLTGRPPFQAASPFDTLLQVINQEPVSPHALNPSVPRDLETLCLKCLEKEPWRRYGSAKELADELERFLGDEPIHARPPGAGEQAWRWLRKQQRSVALTAAAVAATLMLAVVSLVGWVWYQDWRLGYVMLKTDRPPLVAEILDERGEPATPTFTVPTQEPVPMPAGEYRLRLSTAGRLSQSYRVSVERGESPSQFSLNLEDQLLGPANDGSMSLNVERSYALFTRQGRADVVLLDATGIRHPGWPTSSPAWSLNLTKTTDNPGNTLPKPDNAQSANLEKPFDDPALRDAPGLRWPWNTEYSNSEHSFMLSHPQIVRDAPDLDGDGVEDLIVAPRHQAWILALSSRDGHVLWLAARGSDLTAQAASSRVAWQNHNPSAVLGAPLIVGDLDGDGTPELLATFADEGPTQTTPGLRRWVECLSGKTGRSIWQFDLDDGWFQLPAGAEMPESGRWLVSVNGWGDNGGGFSSNGDDVIRNGSHMQLYGTWHPAPYPVHLVPVAGKPVAVVVAGTRVIGIDFAAGKPAWEPLDIGLPPEREPQFADLDGDGEPELVMIQSAPGAAPPSPNSSGGVDLTLSAWSLRSQSKLWQHALVAETRVQRSHSSPSSPQVAWPLVEDLDGDGRSEVIVPNRTPDPAGVQTPWAEIEVLEGATGQSRWRRRLKTMDQQVDHFLVGPDVDGDGQREVFAATLTGQQYDLYLDALSGKDGHSVWWSRRRTGNSGDSTWIEGVAWWHPGDDGWPRLLVTTIPQYNQQAPMLYTFSSGRGQFLGATGEIDEVKFADGDGDGLVDMFALHRSNASDPNQGGRLHAMRGTANERWRRLGGAWQAGADYDGDGWTDLVALDPGRWAVAAISGRDGLSLWRTLLDYSQEFDTLRILDTDLDGDGIPDVIAFRGPRGSSAGGLRPLFPVTAVSGRTGAKLWTVEMPFASIAGVLFAEARDLDGDGTPEVMFSTFSDWDYPQGRISGTNRLQHWLAVVDGRTGKFRWRQPLSAPYGMPGAPPNPQYQARNNDVRPAFADLDRDGVTDLVVLAETADSATQFELRAFSGRDGKVLWRRPCPPLANPIADIQNVFEDAVTPAVADLDGDGKPELIGLEYVSVPVANSQPQRQARVFAIDAATGKQRWEWQTAVGDSCGRTNGDPSRQATKPRPLVMKRRNATPRIAVGLWGWSQPTKIVVLDDAGRLVGEPVVQQTESYNRPWVCDVDADGNDDLVVFDAGKLKAVRVADGNDDATRVLWEAPVPSGYNPRLVDLLPATADGPSTIIVQSGPTVYGLAGTTGKPMWINAGPQPVTAAGSPQWVNVQLLRSSASSGPPAAVFQGGDQIAVCRVPRLLGEKSSITDPQPTMASLASATSAPALAPDPRLLRRLPWALDVGLRVRGVKIVAWGMFTAILLLLLPGWTLYRMLALRQWSLRTLMLLPALAGLMLVVIRLPVPEGVEPYGNFSLWDRVGLAFTSTPPLLFACLFVHHVRRRHWRAFLHLGLMILGFAGVIVLVAVLSDLPHRAPGEHYTLADWDVPLVMGFYATSWVVAVVIVFSAARNLFRRRRPVPANGHQNQ